MDAKLLATLAIGALVPLVVGGLYAVVRDFLKARVHVSCPQAAPLAEVIKGHDELRTAVNAVLVVQGPQLEALVALLEATKGQVNGNVDRALDKARGARETFGQFQAEQLKVGQ